MQTYNEAIRIVSGALGDEHVETIELRMRLARAQAASNRAVALRGVRDCIAQLKAAVGDAHPKVGEARVVYAQLLAEDSSASALREARMEVQQAIASLGDALGVRSVEFADALLAQAQIAKAAKRPDDAKRLAQRARDLFAELFGNDEHPKVLEALALVKKPK